MILGCKGMPTFPQFFFITLAMIGARSYAMGMNRILDLELDKKNPRTRNWALPMGKIKKGEMIVFCILSLFLFLVSVYRLAPVCRYLWPLVIVPMTVYPLFKRFTIHCHLFLGFCLSMAPVGAWIAVTNRFPPLGMIVLQGAVLFWVAGFDTIYSCQDIEFDKKEGLYSIPVRFGIKRGLFFAKLFHVVSFLLFLIAGWTLKMGLLYYSGIFLVGGFLWYENKIVAPGDLSRINVSFFTMNGLVSTGVFFFTVLDMLRKGI